MSIGRGEGAGLEEPASLIIEVFELAAIAVPTVVRVCLLSLAGLPDRGLQLIDCSSARDRRNLSTK